MILIFESPALGNSIVSVRVSPCLWDQAGLAILRYVPGRSHLGCGEAASICQENWKKHAGTEKFSAD